MACTGLRTLSSMRSVGSSCACRTAGRRQGEAAPPCRRPIKGVLAGAPIESIEFATVWAVLVDTGEHHHAEPLLRRRRRRSGAEQPRRQRRRAAERPRRRLTQLCKRLGRPLEARKQPHADLLVGRVAGGSRCVRAGQSSLGSCSAASTVIRVAALPFVIAGA